METKKLIKYLLDDLHDLEELFAGRDEMQFDELEMDFLNSRIKGAIKLVKILESREAEAKAEVEAEAKTEVKAEAEAEAKAEAEVKEDKAVVKPKTVEIQAKVEEVDVEPEVVTKQEDEQKDLQSEEKPEQKLKTQVEKVESEQKMEPVPEPEPEQAVDVVAEKGKRLGDSFSKEKSINDIMHAENTKLEHKLSNRPVSSIQTAIGINDRFQYIRELFDGKAELFDKTVSDIDSMNDLKEAIHYLQKNFSWKKNETSLKFASLVKRRFPDE